MTRPRLIYLHGFASSPGSFKAQRFAVALKERGIEPTVPDLNEGDFRGLTLSRQLALVERLVLAEEGPVVLIGSSLGGYTAALYSGGDFVGAKQVQAQVLMAPAFDFAARWAARLGEAAMARWERAGEIETEHFGYGKKMAIGFGLIEDARGQPAYPPARVPTLVIHGRGDETVDPAGSERFAAENKARVELELIDSDHGLADGVSWIIERSLSFLQPFFAGGASR